VKQTAHSSDHTRRPQPDRPAAHSSMSASTAPAAQLQQQHGAAYHKALPNCLAAVPKSRPTFDRPLTQLARIVLAGVSPDEPFAQSELSTLAAFLAAPPSSPHRCRAIEVLFAALHITERDAARWEPQLVWDARILGPIVQIILQSAAGPGELDASARSQPVCAILLLYQMTKTPELACHVLHSCPALLPAFCRRAATDEPPGFVHTGLFTALSNLAATSCSVGDSSSDQQQQQQ